MVLALGVAAWIQVGVWKDTGALFSRAASDGIRATAP